MKRVIADFIAFGRQSMRSTIGMFFTFIFPIMLILIFGAIFSGQSTQKITLHVQDADDTQMSHALVEILNNTSVVDVKYIPSEENITDYIKNNSLSVALRIPEGFEASINFAMMYNISYPVVNVTLYGDPSQTTYSIAQSAVAASTDILNYYLSNTSRYIAMETENVVPQEFHYIDFFLPGMIGFTAMTTPLFAMASLCSEYRNRGYFKLLATTPIKKSEWLVSKILWYIVVIYASFALMVVVGIAAFGLKFTLTLIAIIMIAMSVLLFTSMGMLIGAFTKNPETSAAIAQAIGFPMMFLSGLFFPIDMMPPFLKSVAQVLPLTYVNEGLRATMIYNNSATALINLAVVSIIAVIFFALAAKAMSWKKK